MASKIYYLEIILLYLSNYTISHKINWNSEKCNKFINNLDIICIKIKKNKNGIEYCDEWEVNNIPNIFIIPEECYNKKYNLNISAESHKSKKFNFDIYIDREKIIKIKKKELEIFKTKKEDIKYCLKEFYKTFSTKANNEEEEKEKNENKKLTISSFCYYTIDDLFKYIEKNANIMIKYYNKNNKDMDVSKTIDYYLNNIKLENIENIMKNIYEYNNNQRKSYFEEENKNKYYKNDYFNSLEDDDNEFEKYDLIRRKDCIEYGIKSINEDIIICTKYE